MSGIRIKNLQSASEVIENFDKFEFVVDSASPDATLKLTGAELKEAVGLKEHKHPIHEVENLQDELDEKFDKAGGVIEGDLRVAGDARMKSLRVDEYLEVPELKYNRITATGNEMWITDAGIVDEVLQDSDGVYIVRLKENEGETTVNFEFKDILRGIFYTTNESGNSTGFKTAFFEVTGIASQTVFNCIALNGIAPERFMTLARQGNKSNYKRQGSIYLDGLHKFLRVIDGVTSGEIDQSNVKVQLGDLSDINHPLFGQLEGYGALLENAYISGRLIQKNATTGEEWAVGAVSVQGEQMIRYAADGTPENPTVTLTATEHGITSTPQNRKWQHKSSEEWIDIAGANGLSFALSHNDAIWGGRNTITLRYIALDRYDDSITITKVGDGQKGENGRDGQNGQNGMPGSAGAKGDKGDKGNTGEIGQKGDQGATGQKGDKGDQGDKGDKGATGSSGPSIVFQGIHNSATLYYNNPLRCDIVKYGASFYLYRGPNGMSSSWNTGYWQPFGASFDSIATGILFAENATIQNGLANELQILHAGGGVVGGISGKGTGSSSVRLWFGGTRTQADSLVAGSTTSPVKTAVTRDGRLFSKSGIFNEVQISGGWKQPFQNGKYELNSSGTHTTDGIRNVNNVFIDGNSWGDTMFELPWNSTHNGFRFCLINRVANTYIKCNAPSGKYFYEDSNRYTALRIDGGQMVEAIGWGIGTTFYGYVILKRSYANQSGTLVSGSPPGYLPMRAVVSAFTTNYGDGGIGASIPFRQKYAAYTDRISNIIKQDEGRYRVNFATAWGSADNYQVVPVAKMGYGVRYAGIFEQTTTSFQIITGDDGSPNNAGFHFTVYWTKDYV